MIVGHRIDVGQIGARRRILRYETNHAAKAAMRFPIAHDVMTFVNRPDDFHRVGKVAQEFSPFNSGHLTETGVNLVQLPKFEAAHVFGRIEHQRALAEFLDGLGLWFCRHVTAEGIQLDGEFVQNCERFVQLNDFFVHNSKYQRWAKITGRRDLTPKNVRRTRPQTSYANCIRRWRMLFYTLERGAPSPFACVQLRVRTPKWCRRARSVLQGVSDRGSWLKSGVYSLQRKNGKKLGWGAKLSLFR